MAGQNSIQFLRGTESRKSSSDATLLYGQPFYADDSNLLYVGNSSNEKIQTAEPINAGGLIKVISNTSDSTLTTLEYVKLTNEGNLQLRSNSSNVVVLNSNGELLLNNKKILNQEEIESYINETFLGGEW